MIESHEYRLLADFISENWSQFLSFAEDMGYGESDAEKLSEKLEKKVNG
ncbi:hypothetical protein [Neisseria sp. S1]